MFGSVETSEAHLYPGPNRPLDSWQLSEHRSCRTGGRADAIRDASVAKAAKTAVTRHFVCVCVLEIQVHENSFINLGVV